MKIAEFIKEMKTFGTFNVARDLFHDDSTYDYKQVYKTVEHHLKKNDVDFSEIEIDTTSYDQDLKSDVNFINSRKMQKAVKIVTDELIEYMKSLG